MSDMREGRPIDRTGEHPGGGINGVLMLVLGLAAILGAIVIFAASEDSPLVVLGVLLLLLAILTLAWLYTVQPNQGVAITLFGAYRGADRRTGLHWVLPWYRRQKIIAGAVGMVEQALQQLGERGVVDLDEERKAAMVSNLLVVLCADREAQPVVNTGTLYG